ncbi:MAG TPA: SHOCT domain-containing protein [Gaiellaceae bacterium]|jgi:putative membrane protein|nr:SHOCT domain-containing protein [Gaiellaceae bacterium]
MSLSLATVLANSGDHGWWPVFPVLWLALIGLVIWFVVRRMRPATPDGLDQARGILAERYARGEISGDEYRERLEQLR